MRFRRLSPLILSISLAKGAYDLGSDERLVDSSIFGVSTFMSTGSCTRGPHHHKVK